MYVTHHVTDLPRRCGAGGLLVDYARLDQLDQCRRIIRDSATRADNVGLDEFDSEHDFHVLLQCSEIFEARSRDTGRPEAFIVIQPCLLTRTWDPCWAEIRIFYTADIADADAKATDASQTVYSELLKLAVEFVVAMDAGYSDCVVRVASCCRQRYDVLRSRHDFIIIATIPDSVDMAQRGLCDDFVFAKCFQNNDRPRRPTEQIVAAVERVIPNEEFNAFYKDVHLPTMKFLPKCYVFETGLKVNLRPAGKDDMPLLYALMTSVTGAGQGYGVDEFPTLNAFLSMTSDAYNIVVEEHSSRKMVAMWSVNDSWYVRSRKSGCCEASLVISPEFQGTGIGREMLSLEMSIQVELGYTRTINDFSASNERMRRLVRRLHGRRSVVIGCLPRGMYTAGVGWDDQVIVFQHLHDIRPFTEIAEHNRIYGVRSTKL